MRRLLPTSRDWKRWSLPSIYSAIGLLLALIALVPITIDLFAWIVRPPLSLEDRLRLAQQELTHNVDCLERIRSRIVGARLEDPCSLSYRVIGSFSKKDYDIITRYSYGEEKHISAIIEDLKDNSIFINSAVRSGDFKSANRGRYLTLYDQFFLTSFCNWYLIPTYQKYLGSSQKVEDLTVFDGSARSEALWHKAPSKAVVYDGQALTKFTDYLGYID